jgi:hypothetical protein
MSNARFPNGIPTTPLWQVLYQDAILEFDNAKLPKRISQARTAIYDRAEEILTDSSGSERQLLTNALQTLQILEEMTARKQSA